MLNKSILKVVGWKEQNKRKKWNHGARKEIKEKSLVMFRMNRVFFIALPLAVVI